MADEIIDKTNVDVTDKTDKTDDTKDPAIEAALAAKGKLDDLLEIHGFESVEDLTEAIQKSSGVMSKVGDADLEEILEKAKTLDRYTEYWAAQDTKNKKADDEEEDTNTKVAKLEKELKEIRSSKDKEKAEEVEAKEAKRVIDDFTTEVNSLMEKNEDMPKEYHQFVSEFLGVKNPFNEIDITDKVEIRKMAKEGIKKIQEFEQAIIKRYRDGKIKIPDITSTDTDTKVDEDKPVIKNLKDARKSMTEMLTKRLLGQGGK